MNDWYYVEVKDSKTHKYPIAPYGVFRVSFESSANVFIDGNLNRYSVDDIVMVNIKDQIIRLKLMK